MDNILSLQVRIHIALLSPFFRIHAADVVRNMYCILTQGNVLSEIWPGDMTEIGLLTALFSAVVHDYEHKGVNVRASEDGGDHDCP